MKATDQFVTRAESDGSLVKVILSPDHNVYLYQHKGVNFFIHRDPWSKKWNAIESRTGSSIVEGDRTKKECLRRTISFIDTKPNIVEIIEEVIQHQINLFESAKVMKMDEYIARYY